MSGEARGAERSTAWLVGDLVVWVGSVLAATLLRHDFDTSGVTASILALAVGLGVVHLLAGVASRAYPWRQLPGGVDEVVALGWACGVTALVGAGIAMASAAASIPRSVPLIAGLLAFVAMAALRLGARLRRARAVRSVTTRRVIVFGAGEGGRLVVKSLTRPGSGFAPVALVDDDPRKARMLLEGVRVVGGRAAIEPAARRLRADTLAIAVPSASGDLIRDLTERGRRAGLTVLVVPAVEQILRGERQATDLKHVDLADLLGRRPVGFDQGVVNRHVQGKVVLVTGAAGSIGSELCRQLARCGPRRLVLLDRDESGLHSTLLSMTGADCLDSDDVVLADIRDAATVRSVFRAIGPDVVFHAAALKHVPLLERYASEAWQTNVLGTLNVLEAADAAGVSTFVNVSTDKAADPSSVLGLSKQLAEQLTAGFASAARGRYVSVRFGNVIGSRGSVVHTFLAQIDRGGPVTVTHPEVRRYFMLIAEACQLMLQASAMGRNGHVMVLDMGEPVRIVELAEALIRLSGREIDISYSGLRAGEKMIEQLYGGDERPRPTSHPRVSSVVVPAAGRVDLTPAPAWAHRTAGIDPSDRERAEPLAPPGRLPESAQWLAG